MSKKLPVFSDVVTWDALTDNNVVFNNNGTFQKTYLFRGKDGSNMTEDMVNAYYVGLNNIFLRLKANYYIFIEQAKRETGDVIQSHFSDSLLSDFQKNASLFNKKDIDTSIVVSCIPIASSEVSNVYIFLI